MGSATHRTAYLGVMSPARSQDIRAADEYQAPSWGKPSTSSKRQQNGADEDDAISTSPFFTDKESAEALKWAKTQAATDSETAVDDDPMTPGDEEGGGIFIGRRRRDSQVGSYDDRGSIFDGPSAGAVPSSVSR